MSSNISCTFPSISIFKMLFSIYIIKSFISCFFDKEYIGYFLLLSTLFSLTNNLNDITLLKFSFGKIKLPLLFKIIPLSLSSLKKKPFFIIKFFCSFKVKFSYLNNSYKKWLLAIILLFLWIMHSFFLNKNWSLKSFKK